MVEGVLATDLSTVEVMTHVLDVDEVAGDVVISSIISRVGECRSRLRELSSCSVLAIIKSRCDV